jgi:hypothetical protein
MRCRGAKNPNSTFLLIYAIIEEYRQTLHLFGGATGSESTNTV